VSVDPTILAASAGASSAAAIPSGVFLALLLLAAICGGAAASIVRVPRVVGYLVGGVVLRWGVLTLLEQRHEEDAAAALADEAALAVRAVKTLALGLVLFSMGAVFEASHLRRVGARLWKLCLCEHVAVGLLVAILCLCASLAFGAGGGAAAIVMALLLACVALETAPTATTIVLREYDAKGPMGDTILTMTAVNGAMAIISFHVLFVVFGAAGLIDSGAGARGMLWLDLLSTTLGSAAVGLVTGFALSVAYAKLSQAEFILVFLTVLLGLSGGGSYLAAHFNLSLNYLLTCLCAGAVFSNITMDQEPFQQAVRIFGSPVFAAFFVLAGYELHVGDLAAMGWVGAAYVAGRLVGKVAGPWLGVRWANGPRAESRRRLGLGLLCQAGVAIGLADFAATHWGTRTAEGFVSDPMATTFKSIVLGAVVVFELLGPVALKHVVVASGEVKAISLMRRRRPSTAEGDSVLQLKWEALLRLLGFGEARKAADPQSLQTRHIMRTNARLLRAGATIDEVLQFVESSAFNHFPVVDDDGAYVGMIHFSDLRDLIYDPALRDLVTAADIADADSPSVPADTSLAGLLEVFGRTDFGSLAVVDAAGGGRVVGLVEQRDLLRTLNRPAAAG